MTFLVAQKCKPCEIYRRMCDVYGESFFSQKMFTHKLTMGLPLQARVKKKLNKKGPPPKKKTVDGVETR